LLDNIVEETALSGKKSRDIFYSWSSSGRYYSEGEDLCAGDTFVAACKARVSDNFDYPAGVQTLRALAEKGDLEAQYRLASIYHAGEHVAKDDKEAVKWHRLAADRGYTDVEYDLGVMYAQGTGVPKDIQRQSGGGGKQRIREI
jgi:TPR repeat protein